MGGAGDLGDVAHELDVVRAVVEVIIADQRSIGLAAELAEFLLVKALEQRALVPARARIGTQLTVKLRLADVHHLDLQVGVGLRVEDQVMQPAPGAFELLEFRRMDDFVHLLRQLAVERGDHALDRFQHVALDDVLVGQSRLDERVDSAADFVFGVRIPGLEALLEQVRKFVRLGDLIGCGLLFELFHFSRHDWSPYSVGVSLDLRSARAASKAGSFRSFFRLSSAATLPSM